jgi:uncharacterized FlaG/YvyC family protein
MTSEARFNVSLLQTWPVRAVAGGSDAQRVEAQPQPEPSAPAHEALVKAQQSLIAGHLRIELDLEAGRFVQTLSDPTTMEVLRSFPYESQLAFARAVTAYMNAKSDR